MKKITLVVTTILLVGCSGEMHPRLNGASKFDDETLSNNKVNWSLVGLNIHNGNYTEVVR